MSVPSTKTKIEWADVVWNPITGCTPISEGCQNCYAKRMAKRLAGRFGYPKNEPFQLTYHADKILIPLYWKKPQRIFVCSMGDLFHHDVKIQWINNIFFIMKNCPRHTFIVLTKRPENIEPMLYNSNILCGDYYLPNVYLGVSVENQQRADERIPLLLRIPASKRIVNIEPMLGPVDLNINYYYGESWNGLIHGVMLGGESGPGARPMHPDWVRSVRDQCNEFAIPFFFKQWGEWMVAIIAKNQFSPF
ncbi:MAG: phage Gp37/Gp68 family protein, partial [Candidatus Aminicenantes bacterium]